ncbi:inositol monophosphatase [Morchella conica CCBAS932]|uniref:Inositol-1-monophosphatase n=1 Tax=Morchella conica CCBAS932 TaxID=1392247 RepID=A0A3N4KHN8_9PEZI|nr:inositol monophosphatase [Morchella conica CCBAS932]
MADEINHQEVHDFLIEVAHLAGDMITNANPLVSTTSTKKNSADLVTETDQAVEKFVLGKLKEKYPSYDFLGEESYVPGKKLTDKPTFICDPIDGTVNFVHTFPNVCISLALCVYKMPIVGVVYNPYTTHMYTAIKNQGSYLSMPALVAIEWGSDRQGHNWRIKYETFAKLAAGPEEGGKMVHSLRSMGSAALNFCAVAAGNIDLYWEGGCWAWDVAAGWLILTEAGGLVVDTNPGGWTPAVDGRRYMAVRGAPSGQKEIIEEFWNIVPNGGYDYSV